MKGHVQCIPVGRDEFIEIVYCPLERGIDTIISKSKRPHDKTSGQIAKPSKHGKHFQLLMFPEIILMII